MHLRMDKVDWNQLRAFLETAETGSLSAAARKLGQSQPTLSRQVAALELALGVTLFERVGKTMALTTTGQELLGHARVMGAAAHELGLAAAGRSEEVEGVVSVATSDAVAAYLMPKILLQIRQAAPGIQVEVVASDGFSDLLRREADIAIRHVRPEQPELIGRLVRQSSACFYASESWVREHGLPRTAEEAVQHDFIGMDRAGHYLQHMRSKGLQLSSANFRSYADNSVTYWEMVRQGLGIGAIMEEIARETPGMVHVLEDVAGFPLPIWLVTHRELRTARRIRIVFDLLAEILA
ncbi:transcriptional regulator, LysR family [Pseudomonas peli]|uniref:Transcriptional regulator, LysR family n=1 Tax=Pseudomonas peli TaxID=592361 RepID=A0AB37ZEI5_9PSED|nr:LysR family transcriptional regulator [Pseudomonas peli]SCW75531.1 transcriptional regulator, LysR family [Pseudomonas peli]|tara:strand:- start:1364 stop:2248 length:885 start_codon:yes stop_codon:yes gene_type:complete